MQNKYLHPFGTITEQQQIQKDAGKHNITVTLYTVIFQLQSLSVFLDKRLLKINDRMQDHYQFNNLKRDSTPVLTN